MIKRMEANEIVRRFEHTLRWMRRKTGKVIITIDGRPVAYLDLPDERENIHRELVRKVRRT